MISMDMSVRNYRALAGVLGIAFFLTACGDLGMVLPSQGSYRVNAQVDGDYTLDSYSVVTKNSLIRPYFVNSVVNDPDVQGLTVFVQDYSGSAVSRKVHYRLVEEARETQKPVVEPELPAPPPPETPDPAAPPAEESPEGAADKVSPEEPPEGEAGETGNDPFAGASEFPEETPPEPAEFDDPAAETPADSFSATGSAVVDTKPEPSGGTDTTYAPTTARDTTVVDATDTDAMAADAIGKSTVDIKTTSTNTVVADTTDTSATGTDAKSTNATGSNATGTSTTGTDARGTNATGANASGSSTTGADARGTNATGANTTGANATGSNTTGSSATGTDARGTNATSANTTSANATGSNTTGTNATGANASGSNATGTSATGTDAKGTNATGANTTGANASGSNTTGTSATGTDTKGTNATGANASGSNTTGTSATGTDAKGTNTTGANTTGANTSGSNATGTSATGTDAKGTNTTGANAAGTDATGKNTVGVKTKSTDTADTDTTGTIVISANTTGADAVDTDTAIVSAADTDTTDTDTVRIDTTGTDAAGTIAAGADTAAPAAPPVETVKPPIPEDETVMVKQLDQYLPAFQIVEELDIGRYNLVFQVMGEKEVLYRTSKPVYFIGDARFTQEEIQSFLPVAITGGRLIPPGINVMLGTEVRADSRLDPYVIWHNGKKIISQGRLSDGANYLLWKTPEQTGFHSIRAEVFPLLPGDRMPGNMIGKIKELSLPVSSKSAGIRYFSDPSGEFISWYQLWGTLDDAKAPNNAERSLVSLYSQSPRWIPFGGMYGLLVGRDDSYTLPGTPFKLSGDTRGTGRILFRLAALSEGAILNIHFAGNETAAQGEAPEGPAGTADLDLALSGDALILRIASGDRSREESLDFSGDKAEGFITVIVEFTLAPDQLDAELRLEDPAGTTGPLSIALDAPISGEGAVRLGGAEYPGYRRSVKGAASGGAYGNGTMALNELALSYTSLPVPPKEEDTEDAVAETLIAEEEYPGAEAESPSPNAL
jgi:uncharacterized protein YjbI with pentapeptide repeats